MIFGFVELSNDGAMVRTRNEYYSLMPNMHVSARPTFRAPGLILAAALAGFGFVFQDLAYPGELQILAGLVVMITVLATSVSRLTLFDRDLRNSDMATLAWGTLWHLRRKQCEIGQEIARIKRETRS